MKKYNFQEIEKRWQKKWREEKICEPDLKASKNPFYNLMMFPYPSAEGLHVGNMYAFTGSDIYGRFKRMQGYDVFEPIGLDGFGIHSENYALKIGAHPMEQAEVSEKRFYEQLQMIGNGFAWDERLETYDPEYYKWTQWIFTEMWKRGLAYRKKQEVNWCPSCKTVLADEQAVSGKCERCGSEVIKKELEQWFFKITAYAEKLLRNLEKLDWSERVKIAQRNWIGRSEGAIMRFPIVSQTGAEQKQNNAEKLPRDSASVPRSSAFIGVFTTRPDTLFGATYMVLSPEHPLITSHKSHITNYKEVESYIEEAKKKTEEERIAEGKDPSTNSGLGKTGVELKGIKAINPATKEEIPIWVADYVLSTYGTGAIMAVPAHDERDFEFASRYKLPVKDVVAPRMNADNKLINADKNQHKSAIDQHKSAMTEPYIGEGHLINSGKFDGMDSEKAKWEITKFVDGKRQIQYRLRDWLISRQRYWGAPIPMILCEACAKKGEGERHEMPGWYAVPEKDLPVTLPYVKNFRPTGTGRSPLASVKEFYETKCPACGGKAKRETDVSDTFLDSAWYYMRYLDPQNEKKPFDEAKARKWLPVDMYIGGAEHSVLHLLYVRFLAMAFNDWGLLHFEEPFKKFRAHGLLISEGAKMSKSKGNVVNPDELIKKFGADALRMYLMFLAPFEQGGDFRDAGILGIARFLERAWKLFGEKNAKEMELSRSLHRTVKKVTEDIETLHYNTAISALMILLNDFEKNGAGNEAREIFLKLLAPFAPHLAEEIWQQLRAEKTARAHESPRKSAFKSIHREAWPKYDEAMIKEKIFTLVIQVNGKVRDSVEAPAGISESAAKELALGREKIKNILGATKPKRMIYVAVKLINIVL